MEKKKNQNKSKIKTRDHPRSHAITEIAGNIANAVAIKDEDLFFLSQPSGEAPLNNKDGFGLYYHDCRYLSGYEFRIAGTRPNSLAASSPRGFTSKLELANRELIEPDGKTLVKQQIGVQWERVIDSQDLTLHDLFSFRNYGLQPARFPIAFSFSSKFEDVFQIRGATAEKRGKLHKPQWKNGRLQFQYNGADGIGRHLEVALDPKATSQKGADCELRVHVAPGQVTEVRVSLKITESNPKLEKKINSHAPLGRHPASIASNLKVKSNEWVEQQTSVHSDNHILNETLKTSLRDLRVLRSSLEDLNYFAAGLPWYGALFGRDSIIAAYQTLAYEPSIAAQTLRLLAKYQGTQVDEFRDEQPGKILHELRHGEMAHLKEVPQSPYYGSVDSTPLFLILLAEHAHWIGSLELFQELKQNIERAFQWIAQFGDESGHGWLEYSVKSSRGLGNQGWKDSGDSIVNADGTLAKPPIALVEVQGYVYLAKSKMADLYQRSGDQSTAQRLRKEARDLRQRFNSEFWISKMGTYALALQQGTRPCAVVSSNPGQAMWSGIADHRKAGSTVKQLMKEEMFNQWGVRTLSSAERRYNPMGYHLGTIWPHDNSFVAAGFRNYGFDREACQVFEGILGAARHFEHYRLPEVFCGFSQKDFAMPVRYPVACHPQAWAAGSVPFFVQNLLGIVPNAFEKKLNIMRPVLPDSVNEVEVKGLRLGQGTIDLKFEKNEENNVTVQVLQPADVEVEVPATKVKRAA